MSLLSRLRSWLNAAAQRPRMEREMDVELRHYFESYTEDLMRSGVSREEAKRRARLQLGGMESIKEECRDARGARMLETLLQDLRFAFRVLRKNPGFTAVVVLTLALGIGANTAVFSVVNAVLLHPLPYKDPERLVWTSYSTPQAGGQHFLWSTEYFAWHHESHAFEDIAFSVFPLARTVFVGGEPMRLDTTEVSANFFQVLGVHPGMGRAFLPEEGRPGGALVAIISDDLWRRSFSADPAIVGREINFDDGTQHTVVGVLPAGFEFPSHDQPDIIWPSVLLDRGMSDSPAFLNYAIARLKPGISSHAAVAQITAISNVLRPEYKAVFAKLMVGGHIVMTPLREYLVGDSRLALFVLIGTVVFVLLIACANVANLQLARATARKKEMAIRSALGAKSSRLARQLFTESSVLALAGGAAGLLLALWFVSLVRNLGPHSIPHLENARVDLRVLIFTLVLSLLVGILFGVAPVLFSAKSHVSEPLKEGGARGGSAVATHRPQRILTIAEVALALVLFVGAGLLLRTLQNLISIPPGFNPHNVLTVRTALPYNIYRSSEQSSRFFLNLVDRVRVLPGIVSVGAIGTMPDEGRGASSVTIEGRPVLSGQVSALSFVNGATPDYFSTLQIPLVAGRFLSAHDWTDFQSARGSGRSRSFSVVVNEAFANRYFPSDSPLQKRFKLNEDSEASPWHTIVGVVGDVPQHLAVQTEPECFFPWADSETSLVIRSVGNPIQLVPAVREQLSAVDKNVPVTSVETMEQMLARKTASQRFTALMMSAFAALAVLLAAAGIYGVMAYAVSQRTREIGVRMALGAESSAVLRMVLGQGLRLALGGVAIGLVASFGLTQIMSSMLYGVTPSDPLTFCFVTALLVTVALAACYIPARRAMRLDPVAALRSE